MKVRHRGDRITGWRAYGGVLIVPARLDGKRTTHMLVDSGAAHCLITPRIARLPGYDARDAKTWRPIFGAQGVEATVPSFQLQSLQVGGVVVEGIEVLVVTFSPRIRIDGVIGVNFLARFRPTLEFDRATLVLRSRPT